MAETHRQIAETETDPIAPIVAALMKALAKNHIAQGQGATGAPVHEQSWHPYDMVTYGDGADGLFYDFAVDGTVTTVDTPNFEDGYEYLVIWEGLSVAAATADFNVAVYRETSAAWSLGHVIEASVATPSTLNGHLVIRNPRFTSRMHRVEYAYTKDPTDSWFLGTPNGEIGAIGHATAQKVRNVRLYFTGRDNDAGKAYLLRRLDGMTAY